MTYVPVVPPTSSPPPSPRTRELAGLLAKVLEEYKKSHPATTPAEIRAAFRLVQVSSGSGNRTLVAALAVGLGALMAGVGVVLLLAESGEGGNMGVAMPMVILAVVVFLGILLMLLKAGSR